MQADPWQEYKNKISRSPWGKRESHGPQMPVQLLDAKSLGRGDLKREGESACPSCSHVNSASPSRVSRLKGAPAAASPAPLPSARVRAASPSLRNAVSTGHGRKGAESQGRRWARIGSLKAERAGRGLAGTILGIQRRQLLTQHPQGRQSNATLSCLGKELAAPSFVGEAPGPGITCRPPASCQQKRAAITSAALARGGQAWPKNGPHQTAAGRGRGRSRVGWDSLLRLNAAPVPVAAAGGLLGIVLAEVHVQLVPSLGVRVGGAAGRGGEQRGLRTHPGGREKSQGPQGLPRPSFT